MSRANVGDCAETGPARLSAAISHAQRASMDRCTGAMGAGQYSFLTPALPAPSPTGCADAFFDGFQRLLYRQEEAPGRPVPDTAAFVAGCRKRLNRGTLCNCQTYVSAPDRR